MLNPEEKRRTQLRYEAFEKERRSSLKI